MNEQERAEEHLKTIRRLMERATIYRAISAPTALVGGVLSVVASVLCVVWVVPGSGIPPSNSPYLFLEIWLLVFLLTAGTNTVIIILGAKKRNEPVFSTSMKAALIALAPPFLVAAMLTLLIPDPSDPLNTSLRLCINWAICYGLGLLATGHFAPRSLILLGWGFLLAGMFTLLVASGFGGDSYLRLLASPTIFMGLTFGLFHLIYAVCAWPRKGAAREL